MRPVDVMVIGLLFGTMGRLEEIRDGKHFSSDLANVIGMFVFFGGCAWLGLQLSR